MDSPWLAVVATNYLPAHRLLYIDVDQAGAGQTECMLMKSIKKIMDKMNNTIQKYDNFEIKSKKYTHNKNDGKKSFLTLKTK